MTFDEVMKKFHGTWENGRAIIKDQGGYFWAIATGTPDKYEITRDGQRYVSAPPAVEEPKVRRVRRASVDVESDYM